MFVDRLEREEETIHFVNNLENDTSTLLALYEYATGRIVELSPRERITDNEHFTRYDTPLCHVIDKREFNRLKAIGAPLDDYAVPYDGKAKGRGGKDINYLFWAENPRKQVRLRNLPRL